MLKPLLCFFLLSPLNVSGTIFAGFLKKEETISHSSDKNSQRGYEKFWNIDPYNLESLCAYYNLYRDVLSLQRMQQLFPSLKEEEVPLFVQSILKVSLKEKIFSLEEQAVLQRLSSGILSSSLSDSFPNVIPEKDLGRALILAEFPGDESKATYYSCYLDILALRIHVERLRVFDHKHYVPGSKEYHKITLEAMNKILFYDEGIRYPSKKEMFSDEFSFLSSVADRKFGVCLGVSSLYFSLSQRLGVPLEAVTPPGHIYLRYQKGEINIETTAGGCHFPTKYYCDCLNLDKLRIRTPGEMVGLTFMNQGSFALQRQKYVDAEIAYEKALFYLQDEELQELLGFTKILLGKKDEGILFLQKSSQALIFGSMAYDYLHDNIDLETLILLFKDPGSTYEEISSYEENLKIAMKRSPRCCEGRRRLASVALHLGKTAEAAILLERCIQDACQDLVLHLKLCKILCARYDYAKALKYFLLSKELAESQGLSQEELRSCPLYSEILKKIYIIAP
ncbi:transglutaminase family protein [Chlamydia sp. 17-3921]|uniref:transglutaminase family protein n=1 Tax=Chlamydia sp. 17-3921 TaxID=2675798 RepID=UPI00191B7182|nr:transglutaminase family protein [Chlamydia sp. 17-3921]